MASPRRIEKINNLLREEISKILVEKTEIPEDNLITITKVFTSNDAHYATVFMTILGKDLRETLENIEKNTYHIQQLLNHRLKMRPVPKIRFTIDQNEITRERLEKTLAKLQITKTGHVVK